MNIVVPADSSVARWVAERMPDDVRFSQTDISVGVEKDGRLVAGVVYHDHVPEYGNVQVSFATDGPGWATRRTVAALLWPPFMELDCQRVTALIRRKNRKSRTLVEGLGFRLEGTAWKGFGNDHMCIYGLRSGDAMKWLGRYSNG